MCPHTRDNWGSLRAARRNTPAPRRNGSGQQKLTVNRLIMVNSSPYPRHLVLIYIDKRTLVHARLLKLSGARLEFLGHQYQSRVVWLSSFSEPVSTVAFLCCSNRLVVLRQVSPAVKHLKKSNAKEYISLRVSRLRKIKFPEPCRRVPAPNAYWDQGSELDLTFCSLSVSALRPHAS